MTNYKLYKSQELCFIWVHVQTIQQFVDLQEAVDRPHLNENVTWKVSVKNRKYG